MSIKKLSLSTANGMEFLAKDNHMLAQLNEVMGELADHIMIQALPKSDGKLEVISLTPVSEFIQQFNVNELREDAEEIAEARKQLSALTGSNNEKYNITGQHLERVRKTLEAGQPEHHFSESRSR